MVEKNSIDKVIVANCKHGGLAAIRSLGRRGLYVIAMTHSRGDFGTASKYIKEHAWCPDPANEDAILDYLLKNGPRWQGALILETSDYFSVVLSKYKSELQQYYHVSTPDWPIVQTFIDKDETYKLADECDVPHPSVFYPRTTSELDSFIDRIAFPVMIKPVRSHEFSRIFRRKHFIAENVDELCRDFQQTLDAGQPVMLQEIIPGTDEGAIEREYVYINSRNDIGCELFSVKLRQTPPLFGIMRVGKSLARNDEAKELTRRLLQGVNYKGLADVEYKRDPRDNRLKLIEVNVRIPSSIQVIIADGGDVPWIIYQDLVHDNQIICDGIEGDMYVYDLISDLQDALLEDKGLYSIGSYFRPYFAKRKTFFVLSSSDPLPFFKQAAEMPVKAYQKLSKRFRPDKENLP